MKPKDWIVHRNMLLNCDDLLDHFTLNLGEAKAIKNKMRTKEKVGNSNDSSSNKGVISQWSKTKKTTKSPAKTSEDTESENEIEHLQLSQCQIADFSRPKEKKQISERQQWRNKGWYWGEKSFQSNIKKSEGRVPIRIKSRFVSEKDLPKFMEINNLFVSVKPPNSCRDRSKLMVKWRKIVYNSQSIARNQYWANQGKEWKN